VRGARGEEVESLRFKVQSEEVQLVTKVHLLNSEESSEFKVEEVQLVT
jgi:hypothetical protein